MSEPTIKYTVVAPAPADMPQQYQLKPLGNEMRDTIMGLVRHVLTIVGGALVTNGYVQSGQVEMIIGAVIAIAGVAWSVIEKYRIKGPIVATTPPQQVINP